MGIGERLKIWTLMGYIWQQNITFLPKKYRSRLTLKSITNQEEKLNYCLKNDVRNFVNFIQSSGKSKNLHFDGLLLSKVIMFELKKYRGVMPGKMTFGFKDDVRNLENK